jgi:putative polyketide hydroxylase
MSVDVPVLVAGGGPVGLSMAIGLRHVGVDCQVVEKHAFTLDFPKGRRVTTRTLEILRQWGLEQAIRDVALPPARSLFSFTGETLLGENYDRSPMPFDVAKPTSPTRELMCSQEHLEPVLRARAVTDADVRFSTELVGFTQDEDGVTADVVSAGQRWSVRAAYLVAADGAHGHVREALGIDRSGPGAFGRRISILFHADIAARMSERQSAIYWVEDVTPRAEGPLAGSVFVAVDNQQRWLLSVPFDSEEESPEGATEQRCLELVRRGLGDDSVGVTVIGHRFWDPTALVADHYSSGRVFLAGDAAHLTTPEGGLGMNCGIADVHNLAWKLAGVLAGWADPALLETYEPERRPHAVACAAASLGPARPPKPVDGLVLGYDFASAAIIDDGTPVPVRNDPVGDYTPTARPGSRAPHLWLDPSTSTLDLFGHGFVALTDPTGKPALDHAADLAADTSVKLAVHAIDDPAFPGLYGIGPGGVVLVRPDGYVAWRTRATPEDPRSLAHAVRTATGHPASPAIDN